MQRWECDIDIANARCGRAGEQGLYELNRCVLCKCMRNDWCWGTIITRKQRKVRSVSWDRWLAAHVVVVMALGRRRWHEGRWRWQARGSAPRAARERVHGGERADVAHARGALAAGRLRPAARSLLLPPAPGTARALRSPPALRACRPPAHALVRFVLNF